MTLVLHPRAAPPGRLRLWVGAFQATAPPALRWFLDGVETVPDALHPIQSVRSDAMLPSGSLPMAQPRVFSGVYEFVGLAPDTAHDVTVEAAGTIETLTTRTLPSQVPASLAGTFNVLMVSCFHRHEDRKGLAGTIVSQLPPSARPHLSLLMGDQVYLDLPTLQDFPNNEAWLARKFEDDYALNWRGSPGYAQVLAAAPSLAIPDDHGPVLSLAAGGDPTLALLSPALFVPIHSVRSIRAEVHGEGRSREKDRPSRSRSLPLPTGGDSGADCPPAGIAKGSANTIVALTGDHGSRTHQRPDAGTICRLGPTRAFSNFSVLISSTTKRRIPTD